MTIDQKRRIDEVLMFAESETPSIYTSKGFRYSSKIFMDVEYLEPPNHFFQITICLDVHYNCLDVHYNLVMFHSLLDMYICLLVGFVIYLA